MELYQVIRGHSNTAHSGKYTSEQLFLKDFDFQGIYKFVPSRTLFSSVFGHKLATASYSCNTGTGTSYGTHIKGLPV